MANKFLQSCGVKNEPSPVDFARLLIKSYKLRDSINSTEKTEYNTQMYLSILKRIAMDFNNILSIEPNLIESMKTKPILVAVKKKPFNSNDDDITVLNWLRQEISI
jgi:hypothetical protein